MSKIVLELFSGNESFSKVMREKGFECVTVDIEEKFNPTICKDILKITLEELPNKPFILWASVPCQTFSIASVYVHWDKGKPKSKDCLIGLELLDKTIWLIKKLEPKYWIIENPRAMMRKKINHYFRKNGIKHYICRTVTYCQYGHLIMKPTDFWSNIENWFPKPMCKPGDSCHESAPRGTKGGFQNWDKLPRDERALVPTELCKEIRDAILGKSGFQQHSILHYSGVESET